MNIGYARVSTKDQNLDLQLRALKSADCRRVFQEKMTGTTRQRPQLDAALAALSEGDTLVVWHLDRLGRSALDLLSLCYDFKKRGMNLRSLTQSLETETPEGEYNFIMACANAQLESRRTSVRTKAGLQAARLRGQKLGRPKILQNKQIARACVMASSQDLSVADLALRFKVGKATMQRALAAHRQ